ncbi:MAG: hypothetical protein A2144_09370 [Chloroflexi bacterium RBG_16_50_9]|nr:MAG: hypothetical protein A2144_09370 [Chloroflexi bacterium RBG_16_50_9]
MLGLYAKNMRIYLDLTQKELAKRAKVSPKYISSLEREQPLPLREKRKILSLLYAERAKKWD